MKIIEDKNNSLLKRREIKVIVESEKNPSMQEAGKLILEHFKAQEENVAIKQIKGKFGRNTFLITANIYHNKEDKEKTEPKAKKKEKAAKEATEEKKEIKEKLSEEQKEVKE